MVSEAEKVYRDHIAKHGESGVILTNLAKVFFDQGDAGEGTRTLRRALDLDPNQDNALPWYAALHNERGGEPAMLAALRDIVQNPRCWRAQVYLAKPELAAGRLDDALALYDESLNRAGFPTPADLLMSISGDLGNAGKLAEILRLVEPRFDAVFHGLQVGNNLIKANLDLGRIDRAREILRTLVVQNRPDWKPNLAFWDTEIAKANIAAAPAINPDEVKIGISQINGPVWLSPESAAAELFLAPTSFGLANAEAVKVVEFPSEQVRSRLRKDALKNFPAAMETGQGF